MDLFRCYVRGVSVKGNSSSPTEINAVDMNWTGMDEVPVQPCNMVLANSNGRGHFVHFGVLIPPFKTRPGTAPRPKDFQVQTVARLYFAPEDFDSLIEAIVGNAHARDELRRSLGIPPIGRLQITKTESDQP